MKKYKILLELFSDSLEKYNSELKHKSPEELYKPESYILSLGGKRIRPLLALIACNLFDNDPKKAVNAALAVELFHNFSLIHDDILDAAPLRRNMPTVHTKWNINIGILSGDVMLAKAFQRLQEYDAETFKKLSVLFSKTAIEVCEGQQMDMNFEGVKDVLVSSYLHMITLKTAVLLGCSLQMGAITAGADSNNQKLLYEFGKHLGLSFQLLDDLLDAFAENQEKFGKQKGGDILANKKTFLLLKAIELANQDERNEIEGILQEKNPDKKVTSMLQMYNKLNIKQICEEEAGIHTQLAIASLEKVEAPAEKKEDLKQFALSLLNRQI